MAKYSNLLCMGVADRSLGAVIQNGGLAADEPPSIKTVAMQLVKAVPGLYGQGAMHGGLKPRLVRATRSYPALFEDHRHLTPNPGLFNAVLAKVGVLVLG